jgi:hypothetical protein
MDAGIRAERPKKGPRVREREVLYVSLNPDYGQVWLGASALSAAA